MPTHGWWFQFNQDFSEITPRCFMVYDRVTEPLCITYVFNNKMCILSFNAIVPREGAGIKNLNVNQEECQSVTWLNQQETKPFQVIKD